MFYHVAFDADSHEALVAKRNALLARDVEVSPIVDHEGWVESIYFMDPNGLLLEYAWQSRALGEGDADMVVRVRASLRQRPPVLDFRSD